jgi:hypothetical protein
MRRTLVHDEEMEERCGVVGKTAAVATSTDGHGALKIGLRSASWRLQCCIHCETLTPLKDRFEGSLQQTY